MCESQKKEDTLARNVAKVANRCVFSMIRGSGGSKRKLTKAAGAEPCAQSRCQKSYAAVTRSAFPSQNVQNTSGAEIFLKFRCRKIVRRCGAKHVSKSNCTKHLRFGTLLID